MIDIPETEYADVQKIFSELEDALDRELGNTRFECDRKERFLSDTAVSIRKLRQAFGVT